MTSAESHASKTRPGWWLRCRRWLFAGIGFLCRVLLVGWAILAIYYSNLPGPRQRLAMAIAFAVFAIWALWLTRKPRMFRWFAGVFLGVVIWWILIPPSHDRPWRLEVAVLPRVTIDGDRVHLTAVRNFTYRTRHDFDIRYEEREVLVSHLQTVDLFVSYWREGPVGHTFLSFGFDNAPPVSISIETRPEMGEGFDPIASLFKQFELIYMVGNEHDLVASRAIHRNEAIFLYRIRVTPENARQLFLIYLERVNEIYDQPEWYHLLSNSCTINIIRYANRIGPSRGFDLRHFLNGFIDHYVYATGLIETDLPFDELRRRSHINDVVRREYDAPDFSERIRAGLPTIHP